MPSKVEEDWSDSDSDYGPSDDVQLGIPDGPVSSQSDLHDPCVSRIGGHPAFVMSYKPDISCLQCKNCSDLMPMAIQIWCPLEDSPMDRALYVWACSKGSCQKKDGSVRAWRGLRLNEKYAAKLAKKAAVKKEQEKRMTAISSAKINPFSLTGDNEPGTVDLGSQIFGGASASDIQHSAELEDNGHSDDDTLSQGEDEDESDDLAVALDSTKLDSSIWMEIPAYPAQYLSTTSEYLPPPPKVNPFHVGDPLADGDRKNKGSLSVLEAYENSLNVDEVFSRFTKRVALEGQQCIRYDLKGTPLPFASDTTFNRLFPTRKSPAVTTDKRTFSSSSIPQCKKCQSPRVFECQLMPHLINVVRLVVAPKKTLSDEERRREVERELKNKNGMEWGTCMIFCCESDCCTSGKEGWEEEYVVVQWE